MCWVNMPLHLQLNIKLMAISSMSYILKQNKTSFVTDRSWFSVVVGETQQLLKPCSISWSQPYSTFKLRVLFWMFGWYFKKLMNIYSTANKTKRWRDVLKDFVLANSLCTYLNYPCKNPSVFSWNCRSPLRSLLFIVSFSSLFRTISKPPDFIASFFLIFQHVFEDISGNKSRYSAVLVSFWYPKGIKIYQNNNKATQLIKKHKCSKQ